MDDMIAQPPLWRNRVWVCGLLMVVLGAVVDLLSFTFAPVSLLAPLGAMTLLFNLCMAPCCVGESPTRRDVLLTLMIFGGAVLTVAFGSKAEPDYDVEQLIDLYFQRTVLAYALLFLLYMATVMSLLAWLNRRPYSEPGARFQAFAYPSMAGAFGSASVLFAKSVGKLVETTMDGSNQFTHAVTYVLLCAMLVSVALQTWTLNVGLARTDSLFAIPVYNAFWVVSSCAVGMLYFADYKTMSDSDLGVFFLGVAITVLGIALLCLRASSTPPPSDAYSPSK